MQRFLAALLAATPVPSLAQSPSTPFEPLDVFELEYASDPRVSPNGEHTLYVRNFMDVMKDVRRSNLWLIEGDGARQRALTSGDRNDGSPRWSPDGTRVAYVSGFDGSPQLYVRWLDSDRETRVAQLTSSPSGLSWSPDGKWLAFSMLVKKPATTFAKLPPKPKGAEWADSPTIIDKVTWRSDGSGIVPNGYSHIFVVPADGGTPRQVTTGDFHHRGTPAWTPDSGSLVFSANRRTDWEREPRDTDVFEVLLSSGTIRRITDRRGPDDGPVVSPDGKLIAWTGFDDRFQGYQLPKLYVARLDGGEPRMLARDLDRSVRSPRFSSDGASIWFQYDDEGSTKVARVACGGGAVEVLATDLGGTSIGRPYGGGSFTVGAGDRFAYTIASPERPADVAVGAPNRSSHRVTGLNEDLLAHRDLATVEEIWCESKHDGKRVQAWLAKPHGFQKEKRYPLLLEIHGGPFANYGPRFAAEIQLYAAAGYCVLYVNPRGSTSYGEEFGNAIHHAYPGHDYDDLMTAVDAVLARGFVDEQRLYVTGGSGGGVLSAWIVGKTNRFRAAVVQKPVIDWYSFVLTADGSAFFSKYWFPGMPWDHVEHYHARSPISLVGNVTTPTMLLTGEEDWRTPISQSEEFYQALKLRGVDTMLVRVPGASHGIARRPSRLIAKVAHVLEWFERHGDVKQSAQPAAAERENEMPTTIADRIRTEVEELHAFFEAWFHGDVTNDDATFSRFGGALAHDFEIVAPSGRKLDREGILNAVRSSYGNRDVSISVKNVRSRSIAPDTWLVTYEEWQRAGSQNEGRLSTAVMRAEASAPRGLAWLHVHEVTLE